MDNSLINHAELLVQQLGVLFRNVNDRQLHRSTFNRFTPMGEDVSFKYEETETKGRSFVDIMVRSATRSYTFRQWYNFGVLLHLEVTLTRDTDARKSLLSILMDSTINDDTKHETLVDFEYALSVATESVANNLTALE